VSKTHTDAAALAPSDPTEQPTLSAMRAFLWDSIKGLREGRSSAANVNAISNASGKIISGVKVQMEYAKATGRMPSIPLLEPEPVNG
jgi:hypothetical protein